MIAYGFRLWLNRCGWRYAYDVYGNITWKSDVGKHGAHFSYGQSRPNRLLSVQSGASSGATLYTFSYDGFGNVTNDGKQSFVYSSFDKPLSVTRSSTHASYFAYGPNRELVKQTDIRDDDTTVRYLFGGYEVVELPSGATEHRMHVGGTVVTHTESAQGVSTELLFMHTDVQGSTVLITANVSFGDVLRQQLNYDPWGKQALIYTSSQFITGRSLGDSHGYTGHTMVNDFDLVHMGGRTYNPVLGRFMQADPFIQAGANLQNYNRYSYVLNNPMSYTDPSGYLFKSLNKAFGDLAPFVGLALMAIPGVPAWATSSFLKAFTTGFVSGGIATGNLRGAINGGLSAAVFYAIGESFQLRGEFNSQFNDTAERLGFGEQPIRMFGGNALTSSQIAGQITAHAAAGGMLSSIGGGKFSHGFISAGFAKGVGTSLNDRFGSQVIAGTLVSMAVGGTASSLAGGKFANGATTAAFQALFNHYKFRNREDAIRKAQEIVKDTYELAHASGRRYGVRIEIEGAMDGDIGTFVIRKRRWWGLLSDEYHVPRLANRMGGIGNHPDHGVAGSVDLSNVEAWVVVSHHSSSTHIYTDHSIRMGAIASSVR